MWKAIDLYDDYDTMIWDERKGHFVPNPAAEGFHDFYNTLDDAVAVDDLDGIKAAMLCGAILHRSMLTTLIQHGVGAQTFALMGVYNWQQRCRGVLARCAEHERV